MDIIYKVILLMFIIDWVFSYFNPISIELYRRKNSELTKELLASIFKNKILMLLIDGFFYLLLYVILTFSIFYIDNINITPLYIFIIVLINIIGMIERYIDIRQLINDNELLFNSGTLEVYLSNLFYGIVYIIFYIFKGVYKIYTIVKKLLLNNIITLLHKI